MTIKPSDRFQVLERPVALPGKCWCCGSNQYRVVDFGVTVEEGACYLCEHCILDAASKFGCVTKEEHSKTLESLEQALQAQKKVEQYVGELSADISTSTARFIGRLQSVGSKQWTEPSDPSDGSDDKQSAEDSGITEGSSSASSKSASRKGSSRVPANSSSVFNA